MTALFPCLFSVIGTLPGVEQVPCKGSNLHCLFSYWASFSLELMCYLELFITFRVKGANKNNGD